MAKNKQSLSEYAYQEIKKRIITMAFPPGKVLSETMLSEMFNISRMPIRSAVQRLLEEGWLDNSNRKMVHVSSISEKDIHEVYDIRKIIECAALKRIFDINKTWEYSFELEVIVVKMRSVINSHIIIETFDLDCHCKIVDVFQSNRLNKMFNINYEEILRMAMLYYNADMQEQHMIADWTALFTAIREKDYEKANRIHIDHLRSGRENTLVALSRIENNAP